MDRPTYKVDLSNEDRVLIHRALGWYKAQTRRGTAYGAGPELYLSIHNRNEEITTLVDGMMGWGLFASQIGYIRMCLAEYIRDQEKEAAKKGPFAAEEFVAHFQELSRKLDKAIDPKAERAWSLSQRNQGGQFVEGNSAASKSDEEKAEPEQIRLYQEDRENIAVLLAVGYAANKTAVVRRALGEARGQLAPMAGQKTIEIKCKCGASFLLPDPGEDVCPGCGRVFTANREGVGW